MRYIRQHIAVIIHLYKGDVPLTHFLKNYFKQHPKLGSLGQEDTGRDGLLLVSL